MRIADTHGLGGVSMARVAAELGFTTMSLYRYVTSKDELLQLMWNAGARDVETLVLEENDWRSQLRQWAEVQRDVLARHSWMTEMPMAAPPMAPNSMAFIELGLKTMDATGLDDSDKLRVIGIISSYTLNEARIAHDAAQAAARTPPEAATAAGGLPWDFRSLLRELVDEQRFPRLFRIAWGQDPRSVDGSSPVDDDEEFSFGLETILDGVQALIDGVRPPGSA
jgi:AcrR family transcriptional regulator